VGEALLGSVVTRGAHVVGISALSHCDQSALLVPVPEAEAVVGLWRMVHDPLAAAGVPAHVTLIVPWVPPEQIKREHLEELEALLAGERAFDYKLDRACWFGRRVLWLSPQPASPFVHLTELLAGHFDTPPWQGEFAEVVPHVTVGHAKPGEEGSLVEVERQLTSKLPVTCRAKEVDVVCGDGYRWSVRHRVTLQQ
jgi:2'-5' RNA ligase